MAADSARYLVWGPLRHFPRSMGVSKRTVKPGNGSDRPKSGDTVTMSYTGYLFDKNRPGGRGKQFDSSNGRGDFSTKLGGGKVIKGSFVHSSHVSFNIQYL